jgi:hypothetical protein
MHNHWADWSKGARIKELIRNNARFPQGFPHILWESHHFSSAMAQTAVVGFGQRMQVNLL